VATVTAAQRTDVSVSEIRQNIIGLVKDMLDRDVIEPDVDLFDQGVPSLVFLRILTRINEEYGIAVDVSTLDEATIDALSPLVKAQLSAGDHSQ
jgi:acyl carrier protein